MPVVSAVGVITPALRVLVAGVTPPHSEIQSVLYLPLLEGVPIILKPLRILSKTIPSRTIPRRTNNMGVLVRRLLLVVNAPQLGGHESVSCCPVEV